jgi:hypothetical protein
MLDFQHFPWFRQASIEDVQTVQIRFDHLYWPTLDVDLHLDSIANPERFPLIAKERLRVAVASEDTTELSAAQARAARDEVRKRGR